MDVRSGQGGAMDLAIPFTDIEEHKIGRELHLYVPRTNIMDTIRDCRLVVSSDWDEYVAQQGFADDVDDCPADNNYQILEFDDATPLSDTIGALLCNGYMPAVTSELFGFEKFYRSHHRHMRRVMPCPYPLLSLGAPSRLLQGKQYIASIHMERQVHRFEPMEFIPDRPFVTQTFSYYVLARCPRDR